MFNSSWRSYFWLTYSLCIAFLAIMYMHDVNSVTQIARISYSFKQNITERRSLILNYRWLDFKVLRKPLEKRGITTGKQMQEALLKECSVALMACGPAFLRPEAELSFRLCYINFDGGKALEESRKIGLSTKLDEKFLQANCHTMFAGIQALKAWVTEQLKEWNRLQKVFYSN